MVKEYVNNRMNKLTNGAKRQVRLAAQQLKRRQLKRKPNASCLNDQRFGNSYVWILTSRFLHLARVKSEGDLFKPVLGKGINLKQAINNFEKTVKA